MRITRLGGPAPPGSASSLLRMKVSEALLLLAAGTAGGIFSTVVAIASLVTYPALLALGVPPLAANMTNTVSLVLRGRLGRLVPAGTGRPGPTGAPAGHHHRARRRGRGGGPVADPGERVHRGSSGADRRLVAGAARPAQDQPARAACGPGHRASASAGRGALRGRHVRRVLRRGGGGHAARGAQRGDPRAAGPGQCDQERVVRGGERPGRGLLRAVWRRAVEARAPARGGLPDRRVDRP